MKAVIGLSLLLLGGFLMYEIVAGHAMDIINNIRGPVAVPPPSTGVWGTTPTPSNPSGRTV